MEKVKYACRLCNRVYDSQEDAAECPKVPAEHFKPGDIVWDGTSSGIFRIDYVEEDRYGAGTTRIDLARIANGFSTRKDEFQGRGYLIGGFWCRARPYPAEEAVKLLRQVKKNFKKRLDAAEELVRLARGSTDA